jgi:glycosyltransferase involved in cell wall biosynthesis
MDLSVVIPARNEPYLQNTIDDILHKADGDVEIIAILDGYWPSPPIKKDPRVILIHHTEPKGMRPSINEGAQIAKGKYLMKCDAHCCFGKGFNKILAKDCRDDYTMVPRRYNLNTKKWDRGDKIYDFQYISNWKDKRYPLKGANWPEYGKRVEGKEICALMTSQGSCWFMHRKRFFDLGMLDQENYGIMGREAQETCLKAWLSGGKYVLSRRTWYAHWKKNAGVKHPHRATYPKPRDEWNKSAKFLIDQFVHQNPKWPLQVRDLNWLVEKFKPVPTWHGNQESMETSRFIRERYKLNDVRKAPIKIGNMGRIQLYELFRDLKFKKGCEVGVMEGVNAKAMLKTIPGLELYLVDTWVDYVGQRKKRGKGLLENALKLTKERVNGYNTHILQMFSHEAAAKIPNHSLDFVYIDANHKFDYTMMDIIVWMPKVRIGGIVAGHDYYQNPKRGMEVKHAVDAYVRQHKIHPYYLTDRIKKPKHRGDRTSSWFWVKEEEL